MALLKYFLFQHYAPEFAYAQVAIQPYHAPIGHK